jgi:putative ABC transport system permease protein
MIKNYLISHLRSLWRNRTHAFINLLGLSLGITCTTVIFLILRFELSFDNYHADRDRIHRVVHQYINSPQPAFSAAMTYPMPPALRQEFPDLEYVALSDNNMSDPVITITRDDNSAEKFKEKGVVFVDPEYLKIFHYDWIEGNSDALKREKTAVLAESMAIKYFGTTSVVNKVINFNNEFDATVAGVIKDPPLNTDLSFRVLLSSNIGTIKRGWDEWSAGASSLNCFVKLKAGVSKKDFDAKLKGWHQKYFTGKNEEDGKNRNYFLQPLKELHFDTQFHNMGGSRVVSYQRLLTLGLIGVLLLLTACINFINLNTVLIIDRSKEAGVRKVMGSSRSQLVLQFLGETFTITLFSMIISAGLIELALIQLSSILEYKLTFHPLRDPATAFFLIVLPIAITLLAGLYPGLTLSRFQPVTALKNKLTGSGKGMTLRRSLIVFQLVISQVLVVCTIIVVQQINHFMSQPIGINSEAIVEFELPENKPEIIDRLKDRLKLIPGVQNATMSNTGAISGNNWGGDLEARIGDKLVKSDAAVKFANEDFLSTYQIQLLHGENLVKCDTANRFLINESLAKGLGFENPSDAIGTPIDVWGNKALVTGVIKDFNALPLQAKLSPMIILCGTTAYYNGAVRIESPRMLETIELVKKAWEDIYPKYVFEYKFLDETISHFYDAERRTSYLIGLFAGVAIFIGCIGLFGLVSFMARRKTKEVGIRKTLGASVSQVLVLFSKEFTILIFISFVIAVPVSYYFMNEWLNNFNYRIQPGVPTYLLGVAVTSAVVIATVGIRSYRAAVANPVDALRDE